MDISITDVLQKYFPLLNEQALRQEVAHKGKLYRFKAGQLIQNAGEYIRMIPLVIVGSIKVSRVDESGHELFLYHINAGETCTMAFSCCMRRKKSEIKTVAVMDTITIGLPIQCIEGWMSRYPTWKNFVMNAYDRRMLDLIQTLDAIAFSKMDERLLDYLEEQAKTIQSKVIITTHQTIATDLNASREAVSRLLKTLERQGIIKLGRNKILLLR